MNTPPAGIMITLSLICPDGTAFTVRAGSVDQEVSKFTELLD